MRVCFVIAFVLWPVRSQPNFQTATHVLDNLFGSSYDRRVRPNLNGAVNVEVALEISSFRLSEMEMTLSTELEIRQTWSDPRLEFDSAYGSLIFLPGDQNYKLWRPDIFFSNQAVRQTIAQEDFSNENSFVLIHSDGKISTGHRKSVTTDCPLALNNFPFDRQICSLELESLRFPKEKLELKWLFGNKSVTTLPSGLNPNFRIENLTVEAQNFSPGRGDRLQANFQLRRKSVNYLNAIYFPAILMVLTAWIALFLKDLNIRLVVLLVCLCGICALMIHTNSYLPKVSFWKASDIYYQVCILFIFVGFVQTTIMGNRNLEKPAKTPGNEDAELPAKKKVNKTELITKIVFILAFLTFNILYFVIFISI